MVDIDTAKRCPRCGNPGKETANRKGQTPGTKLIVYTCKNSRCRWFETEYLVSVGADGTINERKHDKEFPAIQTGTGKRIVESVVEELKRPTGPGRQ